MSGGRDAFSIFDQLTAARAEMEEGETQRLEVGVDITRAKRDVERRERLGQLRAREHAGKRPHRARPAFGPVNPY